MNGIIFKIVSNSLKNSVKFFKKLSENLLKVTENSFKNCVKFFKKLNEFS